MIYSGIFRVGKEVNVYMITIRDVVKRAGVSVATVSRVINNTGRVSLRTREKVLRAMRELGYSPRPWAKYLATQRKKLKAGIVVTERILENAKGEGAFYYHVLEGMKRVAKESGVKFEILKMETSNDCDGFVLVGADFDEKSIENFKASGKPIVLVDHYIPGMKIDAVISDGFSGAFSAISHLYELGHRRIVHIHNPLKAYSFRDRYNGYMSAMERFNLFPKVYEFDDVGDNMSAIIELMLNTYGIPDAIFTSNDFAAKRVYEELSKRGIRVPNDVSLVGFDDSPDTRRLITLMTGQDVHPAKISLFTELVIRGSTKPREGG